MTFLLNPLTAKDGSAGKHRPSMVLIGLGYGRGRIVLKMASPSGLGILTELFLPMLTQIG